MNWGESSNNSVVKLTFLGQISIISAMPPCWCGGCQRLLRSDLAATPYVGFLVGCFFFEWQQMKWTSIFKKCPILANGIVFVCFSGPKTLDFLSNRPHHVGSLTVNGGHSHAPPLLGFWKSQRICTSLGWKLPKKFVLGWNCQFSAFWCPPRHPQMKLVFFDACWSYYRCAANWAHTPISGRIFLNYGQV